MQGDASILGLILLDIRINGLASPYRAPTLVLVEPVLGMPADRLERCEYCIVHMVERPCAGMGRPRPLSTVFRADAPAQHNAPAAGPKQRVARLAQRGV